MHSLSSHTASHAAPRWRHAAPRRSLRAETAAVVLMLYFSLTAYSLSLIPVVADELREQFVLNSSQIGLLTSVLMFALGATAIPSGLAAGRLGGRVIIFGCGVFVAGSVLFALAPSFAGLIGGRLLQGIGAGVTVPACSVVLADHVPEGKRARVWGIFGAGHGLGVMIALFAMPLVARAVGYRGVFLVTAMLATVLGAAVAGLGSVRARPERPERLPGRREFARSVRGVAGDRRVLLLALFNVTTLGVGVGALAWTPSFLHVEFGSGPACAGQLTAMVGAAQLIGNPVGAAAMARWGKLRVIAGSITLLAVTIAMVPFVPSLYGVCALMTLAGFFSMTFFAPLYAYIPTVVADPKQVGLASGVVNIFGFGGALLTPYLFGLVLDRIGDGSGYVAGYLLLTMFAVMSIAGAALFRRASRPRVDVVRPGSAGALSPSGSLVHLPH